MILNFSEYLAVISCIPTGINQIKHRFQIETMLNTGMRYSELYKFSYHPEWFDPTNRMISLPGASTKTFQDRDVHLTPQFASRLELFLAGNRLSFPSRQSMDQNLERWFSLGWNKYPLDVKHKKPKAPSVKIFRKTWETWLLAVYQNRPIDVWMSQGHTGTVSLKHYYASVGKLKSEMDLIREYVKGWGT